MDGGFDYSKVDAVVGRIIDSVNPRRVIIFGSVSRMEAKKDSDLDLLILFDELDNEDEMYVRISRLFIGLKLPFDLLLMTCNEFEHYSKDEQSLEYVIHSTGIIVYSR